MEMLKAIPQYVEPEIEAVDVDGCHLILTGAKAWFFHLFKSMKCEEAAIRELYPYLLDDIRRAKEKKENAPIPMSTFSRCGTTY